MSLVLLLVRILCIFPWRLHASEKRVPLMTPPFVFHLYPLQHTRSVRAQLTSPTAPLSSRILFEFTENPGLIDMPSGNRLLSVKFSDIFQSPLALTVTSVH